jgi:hypothetical protein
MKKTTKDKNHSGTRDEVPGLAYAPGEDIYRQNEKLPLNEEHPSNPNEAPVSFSALADNLDVPGAELDDSGESIGEEDEENNYYSIGGDNHNDLEEGQDNVGQ